MDFSAYSISLWVLYVFVAGLSLLSLCLITHLTYGGCRELLSYHFVNTQNSANGCDRYSWIWWHLMVFNWSSSRASKNLINFLSSDIILIFFCHVLLYCTTRGPIWILNTQEFEFDPRDLGSKLFSFSLFHFSLSHPPLFPFSSIDRSKIIDRWRSGSYRSRSNNAVIHSWMWNHTPNFTILRFVASKI